MTIKLSICIPIMNNWKLTEVCIKFFYKFSSESFELIIVDNGSTDETKINIKKYIDKMKNLIYICNDKNLGFAYAVNQAYKKSVGKNVLFLNNDIIFASNNFDWMNVIINNIDDNLVGPTGGYLDENFNFLYETEDINKKINYMSGWCLASSREVFNKLILPGQDGPFDSNTFFSYFEDSDLSFRAKKMNISFKLIKLPLYHIGKQTSKNLNLKSMYIESREKFIKKWK